MTKGEQARLTAWRLKVLQQAAHEQNVSRVCWRFGTSRKSFYKWKRRHAEHGDAGLCDRPRTPRRSPRATAREVRPAVVFLDVRMPGMNGVEVMQELKRDPRLTDIPIVALTGHALQKERDAFLAKGFDAVISKPCLSEDVVLLIETLLPASCSTDRLRE
jgi:CheY-like chemotaxis protein